MPKKILFIEDEATLHQTIGEALREEGFEVVSALTGEQGLSLAKQEKPDLILLDLVLPGKTGFEVLKEIRENPDLQKTPVIVLTNLEDLENIQTVLTLGVNMYLVKVNYKIEEIIQKIKQVLGEL